jgi:predicted nucleotidyltransferase
MRLFRDRDYVETVEGLFFTVVGNVHPPGRVIAYLKYVPSPDGKWGRERRFRRALPYYTVPMLLDTISYLKQNHPQYVAFFEELGIEMSAVPLSMVSRHYRPEERLQEMARGPRDELEDAALELAEAIADEAGIPIDDLGVTGSILVKIHQPFSDIDLVVYGRESALRAREALRELYRDPRRGIEALPRQRLEDLLERRQRLFCLSKSDAEVVCARKWNRGPLQGEGVLDPPSEEGERGEGVLRGVQLQALGLGDHKRGCGGRVRVTLHAVEVVCRGRRVRERDERRGLGRGLQLRRALHGGCGLRGEVRGTRQGRGGLPEGQAEPLQAFNRVSRGTRPRLHKAHTLAWATLSASRLSA